MLLTPGNLARTRRYNACLHRGVHAHGQGHVDRAYDARPLRIPDALVPGIDILDADRPERLRAENRDELPHPIGVSLNSLRCATQSLERCEPPLRPCRESDSRALGGDLLRAITLAGLFGAGPGTLADLGLDVCEKSARIDLANERSSGGVLAAVRPRVPDLEAPATGFPDRAEGSPSAHVCLLVGEVAQNLFPHVAPRLRHCQCYTLTHPDI